jgi:UDP-N-acetylmuramoyl-L-alanyl-D-glutamate--2,6-diaminopimelate ligase
MKNKAINATEAATSTKNCLSFRIICKPLKRNPLKPIDVIKTEDKTQFTNLQQDANACYTLGQHTAWPYAMYTQPLHTLLHKLDNNWTPLENLSNPLLHGLALHSHAVTRGKAFFACSGEQHNGADFIAEAISRGAQVIFTQTDQPNIRCIERKQGDNNILYVQVPHLKKKLSRIADHFYHSPSTKRPVLGVTGTNGKTSVCHITADALHQLEKKSGIMGTAGSGIWPCHQPDKLTTPNPLAVQKNIADFVAQGASACIMEVSSHALQQHRVEQVQYHSKLFTNLSHDHLDYHQNLNAYATAKQKLFTRCLPAAYDIFNLDDPIGASWASASQAKQCIGFSRKNCTHLPVQKVSCARIQGAWDATPTGIHMHVDSDFGTGQFQAPLLGDVQGYNLLAALALLLSLDVPFDQALEALSRTSPVHGRMERIANPHGPDIIVDFAHTPVALAQVLTHTQNINKRPITLVFGCGGDRDPYKRPIMGAIAEQQADTVILTNDNPRMEPPEHIMQDILKGCKQPDNIMMVPNRRQAIETAMNITPKEGLVLLVGKGHEQTQTIGNNINPFSDHKTVLELLEKTI